MRWNDPFGRMQHRDEVGYQSVRAALLQAGVKDRGAAERVLARTRTRVLGFIGVVAVGLAAAMLLAPRFTPVALALGLLLAAFAVNALLKGRRHVLRFVVEELDGPSARRAAQRDQTS
jgi:hypothetical protein